MLKSDSAEALLPRVSRQPITMVRVCAVIAALAMVAIPVWAADEAGTTTQPEASEDRASLLTEVVVTAQRREQSAQRVGVSLTALSSEQIRDLGISSARDIARAAAGVVFNSVESDGSIANNLSIRGVSQSDFAPIQESPNSIYVDDVYISSPNAVGFATYDLARIEILRGPQGTLFGRASSGGLVNYIYERPTKEFTGYTEAGYGSYSNWWAEGAVSGPIAERLRGRISGRYERADGFLNNTLPGGKDTFETRVGSVRGQLEFDATEALTGRLTVTYERQPRHESGTYKVVSSYVGDDGLPALLPPDLDANGTGPGNDFTGYRDPNSSAFDANFNNVGYTFNDKFSPTLHLDWKLGSATISSLTNYTEFESGYNEDTDGGPVDFAQFLIEQDLRQWSQELRATGSTDNLQWTSGVFYLNTSQRAKEQFVFPELSGSDFAYNTVNELQQKLESIGLFGQLEYSFSDQWRGTLGARYTYDDKSMDQQNYFPELGNGYEGGTGSTVYDPPLLTFDFSEDTFGSLARHKEGMWSGKIQIDYLATDDSLIYASVSRGVKGPAFNLNLGGVLTAEETPVKSEYVYALETGAKVDLLDRRLRVNGSVYYYDYHDFQGFAFNGVASKLDNFDGTFKGGELEVTLAPDESTTIQASAAYLDTELQGVSSPYYLGTRNTNSVSAPEWLFNGLVSKTFQMPADNSLALQWSFDYLSESFSSVDNNRATLVEGSFVHNARLAYKAKSSGLEVAAFVNNISNEERMQNSFDLTLSTGSLLRTYGRPRWVGLSIRKTW